MTFNPLTDLTGVIGWWDTQVTASLTLSGSNVTAFADQSGGGHTLSNFGTVVYSSTALSGSFPGISYISGNNGTLEAASFPMGTGNTLTAWYVGTLGTGASSIAGRIMSYCKTISNEDFDNAGSFAMAAGSPFTGVDFNRNNNHATASGLTASPAVHRIIITIDSSGNMTLWVDGVVAATGTSAGNWVSGGYFDLGRQAARGQNYWYGIIGEAGVATGFTTSGVVAPFDSYLGIKWGLIKIRLWRHRTDGGAWLRRGGVWRRVTPNSRRIILPDDVRKRSHTRLLRAA